MNEVLQCEETDHLIEVLPAVLSHQPERTEQREAEVIEACVTIVRVWADRLASVVLRT